MIQVYFLFCLPPLGSHTFSIFLKFSFWFVPVQQYFVILASLLPHQNRHRSCLLLYLFLPILLPHPHQFLVKFISLYSLAQLASFSYYFSSVFFFPFAVIALQEHWAFVGELILPLDYMVSQCHHPVFNHQIAFTNIYSLFLDKITCQSLWVDSVVLIWSSSV